MNIIRIVFILFTLISCTPAVRVLVHYPPVINLPQNTSLELRYFNVSGESPVYHLRHENPTVPYYRQNSGSSDYDRFFKNQVESALYPIQTLRLKKFDADLYVEGNLDYTVKDELAKKEETKDTVSEEKVTETININGKDSVVTKTIKTKSKKTFYYYQLSRRLNISGTVQFYTKTGELVHVIKISETGDRSTRGEMPLEAVQRMENPRGLILDAIKQSAQSLAINFHPREFYHTFRFKKGTSKPIEDAIKQASNGKWEEAYSVWKIYLNANSEEDRIASNYNTGIYFEFKNDYQTALIYYERVNSISLNKSADQDIERIKNRMIAQKKAD